MTPTTKLALGVLGVALALGVFGDWLLRVTPWGLNVVLWVGSLLAALVALARLRRVALTGGGRWLMLTAGFFVAAYAWHDSATLLMLSFVALGTSLALVVTRTRSGQIRIAGVMDYVAQGVVATVSMLSGLLELLTNDIRWNTLPRGGWSRQVVGVGRGLIIALPLLFVFGGLFVSADAAFENTVNHLFDWDVDQLLERVIWIGVWTAVAGGFLRQTLLRTREDEAAFGARPASLTLGAVEVNTVLAVLNLLFLAFVAVQLRYFFGGQALVEGSRQLTYAEYARRGFFELVTVAALVLPVLLLAHWLLPPAQPSGERVFRLLSGSLVVLLFVIMVSAVDRMLLYQRQFGLTELRLYTTAFMGWLAIVFVWFLATVLRGRRERFAFGALVAGFVVIAALHVLNPDDLIVRVNASRVDAPNPFDARYVASLSADAVPALIGVLPSLNPADRCAIAEQLLVRWSPPIDPDWRTWNLGRTLAWQAVSANGEYLRASTCTPPS